MWWVGYSSLTSFFSDEASFPWKVLPISHVEHINYPEFLLAKFFNHTKINRILRYKYFPPLTTSLIKYEIPSLSEDLILGSSFLIFRNTQESSLCQGPMNKGNHLHIPVSRLSSSEWDLICLSNSYKRTWKEGGSFHLCLQQQVAGKPSRLTCLCGMDCLNCLNTLFLKSVTQKFA